ncbi:hypothetical protein [Cryptosporangium aurantiacum]|uniref:Uncharacterized protein n=1 Tax=Cryptosporangium aurantiacum TaxID=134849 RepID=A0A1M7RJ84_9ACTN|nr:hypothetical protein [Cryptosporangium aurantiacum]SHN46209.1 hypothetical protein SAMN05443668_11442 [Cryptosporangium aurantiacum]
MNRQHDAARDVEPKRKRRRGEWWFQIFGPPTVSNAIQGHSAEARAAWKRRVAEERAARRRKP